METYKNLKKGTKVGLIISGVLVVLLLLFSVIDLIKCVTHSPVRMSGVIHVIPGICMIAILIFYAVKGYRRPHGNDLRILFFIFAVYIAAQTVLPNPKVVGISYYIYHGCALFSALLIAYISGRLNKIEKNKVLMVAAGALLATAYITFDVNTLPNMPINRIIAQFDVPILWTAICLAYVARFEEHKAAGLADKADAEEN